MQSDPFKGGNLERISIMLTMITAFGVKHNVYYDTIQSEITIDQMFV